MIEIFLRIKETLFCVATMDFWLGYAEHAFKSEQENLVKISLCLVGQ
jgi:hypothetical protein